MASTEFVRNLLIEQRRRLVGSIMDYSEKRVYPSLTDRDRKEFRDKVLASVGAYHDTVLDILKASIDDGSLVNETALELLTEIHREVTNGAGRK